MVGASDEVQLVALMRAQKRATIVITVDAGSVASSRAEGVRLCDQDFPHERDQIVRTKWPRLSHQICGTIHRLCGQGGAIISADTDTDSHGVSDPSGHARGHFQRAHRGRSRHVSCSDRGTGACSVGGKERRPSCWCRALTVKLAARE